MRVAIVWAAALSQALLADTLIRNVTLIDMATGNESAHQSVLIHGDRIRAVGANLRAGPHVEVVNGVGKYLIPGLWDMHVHLWYKENQLPQYVAWGITGVRDMGSDLAQVKRWRAEMQAGKFVGPHIETSGPPVDGGPSDDPKLPILVVQTPVEARNTYDDLEQKYNVDFVKVLSRLPRDAYFALLERARKWGLQVAGHVPESVTVDEAIDARQDSIEHLTGVLLACSSDERRIRKDRADAIAHKDREAGLAAAQRVLATFDEKKAQKLVERMARFKVYEVPTLVMLRRTTLLNAEALVHDPHVKSIPASIRKTWDDPREQLKETPAATLDLLKRQYEMDAALVRRMQVSDVPIMAGTDTGDPYTFPGYDLHRELQLLVEAGLTPLEALRAATLTPARFLNADESLGSIAAGKMADLVILNADPLKDIHNTEKISAVFAAGKYLSRARLDVLQK
ncbi:MAG TPA: amidohydrolase family protein [Bryobacteraceae bacterium]|nr:amidohydrolase family protein [Bryobacteraceae bacterium]